MFTFGVSIYFYVALHYGRVNLGGNVRLLIVIALLGCACIKKKVYLDYIQYATWRFDSEVSTPLISSKIYYS